MRQPQARSRYDAFKQMGVRASAALCSDGRADCYHHATHECRMLVYSGNMASTVMNHDFGTVDLLLSIVQRCIK